MTVVTDTNVIAYHLLGTEPEVEETRAFWRSIQASVAPAIWEAELANVLWMTVRKGLLELDGALRRLTQARRLGVRSVPNRSLWQGALVRAVGAGVPAYDSLFVELAVRRGLQLATFDRRLIERFPGIAVRPRALAS